MAELNNENPLIDPNILNKTAVAAPFTQKGIPDKGGFIWGTGRRKSSVARVRIRPGSGALTINGKTVEEYFKLEKDRNAVRAPLVAAGCGQNVDVFVRVEGGGTTGQAGAVLLGIARALKSYDPTLLPVLREGGYLTRDSRMVERKKPGKAGARRSFQFSKR
ncbi:MAG: 30S ribosomal protein S9 [Planctomycetes bacterium]|jgi:small subunit ribosomal protein S9|nr:30S ribosomal protein S9 [Planctomycetota bacterium]